MNVVAIGLSVFGPNKAVQSLYEDLGFEPTVLQMRKLLSPSAASNAVGRSPTDTTERKVDEAESDVAA